jgi:hypothetical protein
MLKLARVKKAPAINWYIDKFWLVREVDGGLTVFIGGSKPERIDNDDPEGIDFWTSYDCECDIQLKENHQVGNGLTWADEPREVRLYDPSVHKVVEKQEKMAAKTLAQEYPDLVRIRDMCKRIDWCRDCPIRTVEHNKFKCEFRKHSPEVWNLDTPIQTKGRKG